MRMMRNRAGWIAAATLFWHVAAVAVVSAVLSCHSSASVDHAGMEDCPMQHKTEPICPRHADQHGSHDCDCPTIGCGRAEAGFLAIFGAVGVMPVVASLSVPVDLGHATSFVSLFANGFAAPPQSPPPRA